VPLDPADRGVATLAILDDKVRFLNVEIPEVCHVPERGFHALLAVEPNGWRELVDDLQFELADLVRLPQQDELLVSPSFALAIEEDAINDTSNGAILGGLAADGSLHGAVEGGIGFHGLPD
jgi:hypothetical protein